MTSVSANSERREHVGINASFENASDNNNTLGAMMSLDTASRTESVNRWSREHSLAGNHRHTT